MSFLRNLLALVVLIGSVPSLGWSGSTANPAPAAPSIEASPPFLDSTDSVDVLVNAQALKGLIAKAKPTFVWNGIDMMWVQELPDHAFRFELNRAVTVGDGKARQCALIRRKTNYIDALDGEFSWCRAEVLAKPLNRDGGDPSHALIVDRRPGVGTLYRVRWGSEPTTGSGLYYTLRDLFVLQREGGGWSFIGEGASITAGRGRSPGCWMDAAVAYRFTWKGSDADRPVVISATRTDSEGVIGGESATKDRRDLSALREGTLDPKTQQMKWGAHAYVNARDGETLVQLVDRVAEWRIDEFAKGQQQERQRQFLGKRILELNPSSSQKDHLRESERIMIPEWSERPAE